MPEAAPRRATPQARIAPDSLTPNLRPSIHEAPEPDIIDQPQGQEKRPNTRTAKTHERQRNAGHRHQPGHHPHIYQNVEQQQRRHPHANVHADSVRRGLRILNDPHDQHEEQRQHHYRAHKSMLLGKGREDEILVGHRQKPELRLGSLGDSLAEHPARPHRDLRLDQLITFALRVALGIEETFDPPLLVIAQEMHADRKHHYRHYGYGGDILPSQSGEKRTTHHDCQVRKCRSQIRLLDNQRGGYQHQARQFQHFPYFQLIAAQIGQIAGYQQYYHQLDEFRYLQVNSEGQRNPACRTVRPLSQYISRKQRLDAARVQGRHVVEHAVVVDGHRHPHEDEAADDVENLFPPCRRVVGIACGAVDLQHADRADDQGDQQHGPIDIAAGDVHVQRSLRPRGAGGRAPGAGILAASAGAAVAGASELRTATGTEAAATFAAAALCGPGTNPSPNAAAVRFCCWRIASRRVFLSKYALITSRTMPAAYWPCSPCSNRATTTISGLSRGAKPMNHAFSRSSLARPEDFM